MRWRNIIFVAAVIALLALAYVFAVKYEPKKEPAAQSESAEQIKVFEIKSADITRMEVSNESGKYAFVKSDGKWVLEGANYVEPVQSTVSSLSYTVSYISAESEIADSAENFYKYGLDNPRAQITVTENGQEHTLLLGSATPTNNYSYFSVSGTGKIYTVSDAVSDAFLKTQNDYRDKTVINVDVTKLRAVEINGSKGKIAVEYQTPENQNEYNTVSVWRMTSPVNHNVENKKFMEKVATSACAVTAESITEDSPKDLTKYGFTQSLKLTLDDGSVLLYRIGTVNGVSYMMQDGENTVFAVAQTSLAFMDTDPMDILESFVILQNIGNVASVRITSPSADVLLEVTHGDTESYTVNGKYASEAGFKSMYQKVLSLTADGVASHGRTSDEELASVTYTMTDGSQSTLRYYPYDGINVLAERDGEGVFFMKKTKLTELFAAAEKFIANPTEKVN